MFRAQLGCSLLTRLLLSSLATPGPPLGTSNGRRRGAGLAGHSAARLPRDRPDAGSGARMGSQPHVCRPKEPQVTRGGGTSSTALGHRGGQGVSPPHACPSGALGRDKQKELEVLMHDHDYDLIGITKAWWAQPHDWNINMEGCSLFWEGRQGIKEECVALYIKAGYVWFAIQGEPGCRPAEAAAPHAEGLSVSNGHTFPKAQDIMVMENVPTRVASVESGQQGQTVQQTLPRHET